MEFASSAVTLNGCLDTSKARLVWELLNTDPVTHVSNEMSLRAISSLLAYEGLKERAYWSYSDCSSLNAAGVTGASA